MSSRPPTSSSSSSSSRLSAADIAVTAVTAATKAPGPRSFFDPWNSSSTGHQRAENRLSGSTSWRESRNLKLGEQYRSGLGGGQRLADTVGAGSKDFGKDGRQQNGRWVKGAKGLRAAGQKSLAEVWGKRKAGAGRRDVHVHVGEKLGDVVVVDEQPVVEELDDSRDESPSVSNSEPPQKQIFEGLCFYLNGSTAPLVSDHKLKHIIAERGGRMSTALGRRSVTHVILGSANGQHGGAGGGLAASKIQKEISRVGGKGVKFVGVEWVLECIKADRRLPESRYSTLKLAPKAQNSVFPMLHAKEQQGGAQG
ncbi:hypothetical protein BCR34DRAFT_481349 [Clohesyomyces aquaticus]|uniref:BRCT domain-containing protein n=1 Tax=Clohesyomyces aquaticus TaxID=1231657 RepID=A0A1Y1ZSR7_9PLEO|nr:hypothetical protein BCR34DRAFT_481349 [Clohesyomyces aquaticus]